MVEKMFASLEAFEYVMLLVCTIGVIVLVAREYGIGLKGGDGLSGNPYADGHNLRFASVSDFPGAAAHQYDGLKTRRNYDGMLGSAEPPVFWGSAYDEVAAGQSQAAGLDGDNGEADPNENWVSSGKNFQTEGAKGRRHHKKEGMLDAALAGGNVTPRSL